jgi:Ca-activated chloride channel family protein
LPFLYRFRKRSPLPFLYYSQVTELSGIEPVSWKIWLRSLPQYFFLASLVLFALGLMDFHITLPPTSSKLSGRHPKPVKTPTEGVALYFVLDVSGSMARQASQKNTKIDVMKAVTERFLTGDEALGLPGRPNDLVGVVTFARQADIVAPLTLDHDAVIAKLRALQAVTDPDKDGTGIGYAIYKTASTIVATRHYGEQLPKNQKPAYTIRSNAIILVTDGFQSHNESDKGNWLRTMGMEEAADYAKRHNIKLYIVNIEPSFAKAEFEPHRNLLARIAESTGGQFFLVNSLENLPDIYREIDKLEKTPLPVQAVWSAADMASDNRDYSLLPWLMGLSLLLLGAAIGIETAIRVVP